MNKTIKVNFRWSDLNQTETAYKVYRSESSFTVDNLPVVYATLDPNTETFTDEGLEYGKTYYYMFGVTDGTTEKFSRLQKIVGDEIIYALSLAGDFQILDSEGKRIYRNKVSNLFESSLSSYAVRYIPSTFDMDVSSNMYVLDNNGKLIKFDPFFNKLWEVTPSGINTTYGCAMKVTALGTIILADVNRRRIIVYNSSDGTELFSDTGRWSPTYYNNRNDGIDIIPTVDKNVFFITQSQYYRSTVAQISRVDIKKDEIKNRFQSIRFSTSSDYISGRGFSDTSVNTYICTRRGIRKFDYIGNELANTTGSSLRDMVNRNKDEFFIVESNSNIYLRSKETLERLENSEFINHDTTIQRLEILDQDRVLVVDPSKVTLYSWETKSIIWQNTDDFNSSMVMMSISGGREIRTITFDEQEKIVYNTTGGE